MAQRAPFPYWPWTCLPRLADCPPDDTHPGHPSLPPTQDLPSAWRRPIPQSSLGANTSNSARHGCCIVLQTDHIIADLVCTGIRVLFACLGLKPRCHAGTLCQLGFLMRAVPFTLSELCSTRLCTSTAPHIFDPLSMTVLRCKCPACKPVCITHALPCFSLPSVCIAYIICQADGQSNLQQNQWHQKSSLAAHMSLQLVVHG